MDQWDVINRLIITEKDIIGRSYKCINQNRHITQETVKKHLGIIISSLGNIREVISSNLSKFTNEHREKALGEYWGLRDLLVKALARYNINQNVPHNIDEKLAIDLNICISTGKAEQFRPILEEANSDSTSEFEEDNMTQTVVEFINTATRLIPEFDGKPENLRSFLDALSLLDTLKDTHEAVAINLIKTKLKGNARNLVENESTIQQIIGKLSSSVKGESVEVLSAKILNIRQNSKSANAYCSEIESLTRTLESAYISDGLSCELASKYSTQIAVKAMTKNCTIDRVKLIMEAGQFGNMNDAIGKFVSSCTEATGQQNAILYYKNKSNNNNYRGGRGRFRGRSGYNRNNNNNSNNYNRNGNTNGNFRGNRHGQNRNRSNGHDNRNNNVRVTNTDQTRSENSNSPLGSNQ